MSISCAARESSNVDDKEKKIDDDTDDDKDASQKNNPCAFRVDAMLPRRNRSRRK